MNPPRTPARAIDESTGTPFSAPDVPPPAVGFSAGGDDDPASGVESEVTVVWETPWPGGVTGGRDGVLLVEGDDVTDGADGAEGEGVTLGALPPPGVEKKIDWELLPPTGRLMGGPPPAEVAIPPTAEMEKDWTGSPTWKHWSSISIHKV